MDFKSSHNSTISIVCHSAVLASCILDSSVYLNDCRFIDVINKKIFPEVGGGVIGDKEALLQKNLIYKLCYYGTSFLILCHGWSGKL